MIGTDHDGHNCDLISGAFYKTVDGDLFSEYESYQYYAYRDAFMQVHGFLNAAAQMAITYLGTIEAMNNNCTWNST